VLLGIGAVVLRAATLHRAIGIMGAKSRKRTGRTQPAYCSEIGHRCICECGQVNIHGSALSGSGCCEARCFPACVQQAATAVEAVEHDGGAMLCGVDSCCAPSRKAPFGLVKALAGAVGEVRVLAGSGAPKQPTDHSQLVFDMAADDFDEDGYATFDEVVTCSPLPNMDLPQQTGTQFVDAHRTDSGAGQSSFESVILAAGEDTQAPLSSNVIDKFPLRASTCDMDEYGSAYAVMENITEEPVEVDFDACALYVNAAEAYGLSFGGRIVPILVPYSTEGDGNIIARMSGSALGPPNPAVVNEHKIAMSHYDPEFPVKEMLEDPMVIDAVHSLGLSV